MKEILEMQLRNILLAAALVAVPVGLHAQPVNGWYVGAGVGINQLLDSNIHGGGGKLTSDVGFAGVGSVGYGIGYGIRLELEGNGRFQNSKVEPGGVKGDSSQYGVMVNALYDFDIGGPVYPYVGLGVGYQWLHVKGGGTTNGEIAGQGIVGVAYPIQAVPGLSLTGEARVLGDLQDAKFHASGAKLNTPVNISGLIGLRYAFNVGPEPVPAAAPPAPAPRAEDARTYLVFFDWDKSDLTARARQIIADAAGASQRQSVTRIEVAGHADTSGTPQYNQGLSMRRAQAVAAELVRDGVKQDAIAISAFGDTKPLVPTGPGVREPQNRRVEIVLK